MASKYEAPLRALEAYLPPGTYQPIAEYLHEYKVHLTVARERSTVLGDYRNASPGQHHRISVNGNLNQYAFLVTLLHELAHLLTFERFGHSVQAHGREWKNVFSQLLAQFLRQPVFPADVQKALLQSLHDPAASSCSDEHLMRVLRKYDAAGQGTVMVEELRDGERFATRDGRVFVREARVRKRIRCVEEGSGKVYLFSPIYEVVRAD